MSPTTQITRRRALVGLAAVSALVVSACSGGDSGESGGGKSAGSGWSVPSTDPTATIKVLSILRLSD